MASLHPNTGPNLNPGIFPGLLHNTLENIVDEEIRREEVQFSRVFDTKSRSNLKKIIMKTILLNNQIQNDSPNNHFLNVTTTPFEILEVMKLRSNVYKALGYDKECPEEINGLSYDQYDPNSIIINCKDELNHTIGSLRVVLPSKNILLPSEKYAPGFNEIKKTKNIGEIGRIVVDQNERGRGIFREMLVQAKNLALRLDLYAFLLATKTNDRQIYSKLGKVETLSIMPKYGNLEQESAIFLWQPDPNLISNFQYKNQIVN